MREMSFIDVYSQLVLYVPEPCLLCTPPHRKLKIPTGLVGMNLILFEAKEVERQESDDTCTVILSATDRRYIHCTTILKSAIGDSCRVGIIDSDMYDSKILDLSTDRIVFEWRSSDVRLPKPLSDLNISIILAMPRPKVLDRLWQVFAQLGCRRVMLVNAERVETAYFHTHVVREDNYRPKLIKGLEQAAMSTKLPEVSVDKRTFDVFLNKRLDIAFPPETCNRFVCHPASPEALADNEVRNIDVTKETVITIGPEGGWLDDEITELLKRGFVPVTCSSRIFTTEVAVIALTAAIKSRLQPELMGAHIAQVSTAAARP